MNSINIQDGVFIYNKMAFKAEVLEEALEQFLKEKIAKNEINEFLTQRNYHPLNVNLCHLMDGGINSSALLPGNKTWLTGVIKVRVKVEFTPDKPPEEKKQVASSEKVESASPLDEIRKDIGPA